MAALILDIFPSLLLVVLLLPWEEAFVSFAGPHLLHVWLCSKLPAGGGFPHFLALEKNEELWFCKNLVRPAPSLS